MKKPIVVFLIPAILLTQIAMAIDFSKFEVTCAEIGFKRNTETFGDCVLELVSRNKKAEVKKESLAAAKQLEYERQKEREIAVLQQQQAIQQQQLAIQQQQAMQQRQQESSGGSFWLQLLGAAAVGYNEGRHPPTVHCTSSKFGNSVDTTCR